MNSNARRFAMAVVSTAAALTAGWSLYAVARHYDAPKGIAGAAVAVFDGIAYMCLHLASEAAADGRSAFGARATAAFMAGVSVYLNHTHADLINGGTPAFALFAVPTLGLLAVSEMSWAGPRARARAERGERPYRLPQFGGWAWALAPRLAGQTVKERAVQHITAGAQPPAPPRPTSATDALRRQFATMDPAAAIRFAHEARPDAPPAELAHLLSTYDVHVDPVAVALVLGTQPPEYDVQRGDAPPHQQVSALQPVTLEAAIVEAASVLGPGAKAKDIVEHVERFRRLVVTEAYVRTALSRARRQATDDDIGKGGQGYN